MSDDKLDELAPEEWFGDGSYEHYWTCGTGKMDLSERRRDGRLRVQIKVMVEPGSIFGTVNDISLGGALVYLSPPLAQGSHVELSLQTERGSAKVGGVVRWRLKRSSTGGSPDDRVGMGIEFVWMSLQMRALFDSDPEEFPAT